MGKRGKEICGFWAVGEVREFGPYPRKGFLRGKGLLPYPRRRKKRSGCRRQTKDQRKRNGTCPD